MSLRSSRRPLARTDFKIAIVCALEDESSAVKAIFDETWDSSLYRKTPKDPNFYTPGRIGRHNVVLASLPGMGGSATATLTAHFLHSYPSISLMLVVGICGGAPLGEKEPSGEKQRPISLGDAIISNSIVPYTCVRRFPDRSRRRDTLIDCLPRPNQEIRAFLHMVQTIQERKLLQQKMSRSLERVLKKKDFTEWGRPSDDSNKIFNTTYRHKHQRLGDCAICDRCTDNYDEVCEYALKATCLELGCSDSNSERRPGTSPTIHFGRIASGDQVMKSAIDRDIIVQEDKVIAFEMEGAGAWDNIPTIIVKSVCDFADSHKNKDWQKYASCVAACCMKALLTAWTPTDPADSLEIRAESVHGQPSLEENEQRDHNSEKISEYEMDCLNLLAFEGAQTRYFSIKQPANETCNWVFGSTQFIQWINRTELEDHRGILWMKGKPGAGKSVLLKHTISRVKAAKPNSIFLKVFFNGQGGSLEKCLLGMFRSILHQLVQQQHSFLEDFGKTFITKDDIAKGSKTWRQEELRGYLHQILMKPNLPPLFIFMDALDEIQHAEIRECFAWVSELADLAMSERRSIDLCITSRHFPNVSIGKCNQVFVDEKNLDDISKYVHSKLLVEDGIKTELSEEIIEHSSGVFMWVEVIVTLLNQQHDQGTSLAQMKREMFKTQGRMNAVYAKCLEDIVDEDRNAAYRLVSWVLFAKRPLDLIEVYTALQINPENPPALLSCLKESDTYLEHEEQVEKLLRRLSKGLIEVTEAVDTFEYTAFPSVVDDLRTSIGEPSSVRSARPVQRRRVQFIHETVKQFFLSEGGLEAITGYQSPEPIGIIHSWLVKTCIGYLQTGEVRSSCEAISNFHRQQLLTSSSESARTKKLLKDLQSFKFLTYSSTYLFAHASDAESRNINQGYLVDLFSGTSPKCWPFWNFQTDSRLARDSKDLTPAAWFLLRLFSENVFGVDPLHPLLMEAVRNLQIEAVIAAFLLLVLFLFQMFDLLWIGLSRTVLAWGIFMRPLLLVSASFFWSKFFPNKSEGRSLLHIVVENNLETCVAKLLENGSNPNSVGGEFEYPICAASYFGYTSLVKLLIQHGAKTNNAFRYRTALLYAAVAGNVDVARILIESGANVNGKDRKSRPIQIAQMLRHEELVKLLLKYGALQDTNPALLAPPASRGLRHPRHWLMPGSSAVSVHSFLQAIRNDPLQYKIPIDYFWLPIEYLRSLVIKDGAIMGPIILCCYVGLIILCLIQVISITAIVLKH